MTTCAAPLRQIRFALDRLAGLPDIAGLPGFEEAAPELTDSVLKEATKIAAEVLTPLNRVGDLDRAKLTHAGVRTMPGWREAWATLVKGGWNGLAQPPVLRTKPKQESRPHPACIRRRSLAGGKVPRTERRR